MVTPWSGCREWTDHAQVHRKDRRQGRSIAEVKVQARLTRKRKHLLPILDGRHLAILFTLIISYHQWLCSTADCLSQMSHVDKCFTICGSSVTLGVKFLCFWKGALFSLLVVFARNLCKSRKRRTCQFPQAHCQELHCEMPFSHYVGLGEKRVGGIACTI